MATNTQKEFRKQMRALAKEGKVSKNSGRRTVRFVEPKTIGFGAGTFLLIVMYNLISGLFYGVPVQTDPNYEVSVYDLAVQIDQRETQLIEEITKQLKAGKRFSSTELSTFKNEVNALRDELPSISEIQGAVQRLGGVL